jgi:hypothetical protein
VEAKPEVDVSSLFESLPLVVNAGPRRKGKGKGRPAPGLLSELLGPGKPQGRGRLWTAVPAEQLRAQLASVPTAVGLAEEEGDKGKGSEEPASEDVGRELGGQGQAPEGPAVKVLIHRVEPPRWAPDDWERHEPELAFPKRALVHVTVMVPCGVGVGAVDVNQGEMRLPIQGGQGPPHEADVRVLLEGVQVALVCKPHSVASPALATLKVRAPCASLDKGGSTTWSLDVRACSVCCCAEGRAAF